VRFSKRVSWPEGVNRIAQLRSEKASYLDLTESNPTAAGIEYPQSILQALADERSLLYDPSPAGLQGARAAVAEYYGGRVSPDQILLTASTSESYSFLFKLLCDPGDEVLVPRPSYPLFDYLAAFESVRVVHYPLRYDGTWWIDIGALERAITKRTRAVILVNPNNPTGSFVKPVEIEQLCELEIPLISDEVFSDYAMQGGTSLLGRAFVLSGLSKVSGLPQMKLGWIAVPDSIAYERLELIADTYLSVATPVQHAAPVLLSVRHEIQARIKTRLAANLAYLAAGTAPLDIEGGWNAIVRVPRIRSEEEWVLHLLRDHDVLLEPGFFYDFESEAHLVLSLLTREEVFRAGVDRLIATL
jgi:aspartate/methionine/tyrosine aminotransferase